MFGLLLRYSNGNIKVLYKCELSEIVEIIDFVINQENDEQLLRAYEASYAALQSIAFSDFKKQVFEKFSTTSEYLEESALEIEKKVAHFIDDYKWEAV